MSVYELIFYIQSYRALDFLLNYFSFPEIFDPDIRLSYNPSIYSNVRFSGPWDIRFKESSSKISWEKFL